MKKLYKNRFIAIHFLLILSSFISINLLSLALGLYVLLSLILVVKNRKSMFKTFNKQKGFEIFIISIPFCLFFISIIWSVDKANALEQIFKRFPLIILPYSFIIYQLYLSQRDRILIPQIFILLATMFSIYGFINILVDYPIDYTTNLTFIHLRYLLETKILYMHPVYIGLYSGVAFVLACYYLCSNKFNKYTKILSFLGVIINFCMMLFISARMSIFAAVISISVLLIFLKNYKILASLCIIAFTTILYLQFNFPGYRFNEIINVINNKSISKLVKTNTLYSRITIYKCAFDKIKEKPLIGYGIGDLQLEMIQCTQSKLGAFRYNSHNQYLEYLLISGLVGLILFMVSVYYLGYKFINRKDYLGLSILIFFLISFLTENILARTRGLFIFSFSVYFAYFLFVKNDVNNIDDNKL